MKDTSKRMRTAIIVLSVLLALSVAGLAGLAIWHFTGRTDSGLWRYRTI